NPRLVGSEDRSRSKKEQHQSDCPGKPSGGIALHRGLEEPFPCRNSHIFNRINRISRRRHCQTGQASIGGTRFRASRHAGACPSALSRSVAAGGRKPPLQGIAGDTPAATVATLCRTKTSVRPRVKKFREPISSMCRIV